MKKGNTAGKIAKKRRDDQQLTAGQYIGAVNAVIYLTGCAVNKTTPSAELLSAIIPDDTENRIDLIRKAAKNHSLGALTASALESAGLSTAETSRDKKIAIRRAMLFDEDRANILAAFDAAGIPYMPLKGVVLKEFYPSYGMREMADNDIWFLKSRADDVRKIFENAGFETEAFDKSAHDVYMKKPVSNFEMHRVLYNETHDPLFRTYYENVEERMLPGDGFSRHLSPEDFYVYITTHACKHYSHAGTGLRSLLDVYVYLGANPSLDFDYIAAEIEKLGIKDFEATARSLSMKIFGDPERFAKYCRGECDGAECPLALDNKEREMLEYIRLAGTYGTLSNKIKKELDASGGGKISKLKYITGRFFVPISRKNPHYAAMANWYPFFYKHKILLPALPFYRLGRSLKKRPGAIRAELKAVKSIKDD